MNHLLVIVVAPNNNNNNIIYKFQTEGTDKKNEEKNTVFGFTGLAIIYLSGIVIVEKTPLL